MVFQPKIPLKVAGGRIELDLFNAKKLFLCLTVCHWLVIPALDLGGRS